MTSLGVLVFFFLFVCLFVLFCFVFGCFFVGFGWVFLWFV